MLKACSSRGSIASVADKNYSEFGYSDRRVLRWSGGMLKIVDQPDIVFEGALSEGEVATVG
jgi:hypothetical protein